MCLYLKNNVVNTTGIVKSFGESGMSILIPDYDIDRSIQFIKYKSITESKIEEA